MVFFCRKTRRGLIQLKGFELGNDLPKGGIQEGPILCHFPAVQMISAGHSSRPICQMGGAELQHLRGGFGALKKGRPQHFSPWAEEVARLFVIPSGS